MGKNALTIKLSPLQTVFPLSIPVSPMGQACLPENIEEGRRLKKGSAVYSWLSHHGLSQEISYRCLTSLGQPDCFVRRFISKHRTKVCLPSLRSWHVVWQAT